jgi:hypothetical protein
MGYHENTYVFFTCRGEFVIVLNQTCHDVRAVRAETFGSNVKGAIGEQIGQKRIKHVSTCTRQVLKVVLCILSGMIYYIFYILTSKQATTSS